MAYTDSGAMGVHLLLNAVAYSRLALLGPQSGMLKMLFGRMSRKHGVRSIPVCVF
jgi:hypothetical protein